MTRYFSPLPILLMLAGCHHASAMPPVQATAPVVTVASATYCTVTGSAILNAAGTPLASGTVTFTPVDATGNPTSFAISTTPSAIISSNSISVPVTNGVMPSQNLVRSDMSLPVGIGYSFLIHDNQTLAQIASGTVYFNTPTYDIAGFVAANVKTAPPLSYVMGPQGPSGPAGPQGLQGAASTIPGPVGPQGPQGLVGPQGLQGLASTIPGPIGPQGPQGIQGAASTIAGPQGPKGDTGATGATGAVGQPGATGAAGNTGAVGPQGVAGPVGQTGPQGATGNTGNVGPAGPSGAVGSTGPQGAQGVAGITPTFTTPTANSLAAGDSPTVAVTASGNSYQLNFGIPAGATGPTGSTGLTGATGAAGAQGPQGVAGSTGAQGVAGATGAAGVSPTLSAGTVTSTAPGSTPSVSDSGSGSNHVFNFSLPQGLTGATGATGAQGATGPTGQTGATGVAGAQGPQGATGVAGVSPTLTAGSATALASNATPTVSDSVSGTTHTFSFGIPAGATGPAGANGATGPQGPIGQTGATGQTGPAGATGSAGTNGTNGVTPTIAPGSVTQLASTASPTVTDTGSGSNHVFAFGIPAGPTGATGATGPQGPAGTATASGSTGQFQVVGSNGQLAAASYTPVNPTNNGSDFSSASTTLKNLGGLPLTGGQLTGELDAQAVEAEKRFEMLPTISVTHKDFTAAPYNCANSADPTGVNDSTCAINAALTYANSYANTLKGTNSNASGLHACVFLDPGFYKVSGNGIQLNESYCLKGWSSASTVIASTDPTRSAITYGGVNAVPYSGTSVYVPYAFLGDLDIVGNGKATTGNLLEIDLSFLILNNVQFFNTGGRAFQANGGERLFGQNLSFYDTRLPMMLGGDDNESTFVNLNGLDNGHTNDAGPSGSGFSKWCYGVNCTNGSFTAAGTNAAPATLYPPTLADVTNQKSVNVRFIGGDMKGNSINAAFRNVSGQQFVIDNMYTEAPVVFPAANMGASYIQGGVTPRTTLTSGFTSTTYGPSTVYLATIADSSQMPLYFGLAADAESYVGTQDQYTPLVMYPSDYVPGSTTASTTCSGLNKGSYEVIFSGATYGGNNIAIFGRSSGGTNMPSGVTNYNWGSSCTSPPNIEDYTPANAQVPSMTVQGHMNNVQGTPTSNGYTYVVNSGPQCAGEVIAGVCADAPGGFFTAPNATGDPLANISAGTITIGDQTSMVNGSNNLYAGSVSVVRRTNINVIGGSIAKDASINEPFAAVLTTAANSPIGVANTEYISLNSLTSGEYVTAYPDANNVPVQTELYAPYVHETWNTSTGFWQRDACRFTSGYYGCGLMSNNWWIMANSPVTAFAMNFTGSQFNWYVPHNFLSPITPNGGIIWPGNYTYPSATPSSTINQNLFASPNATGTMVFPLPAATPQGNRVRVTIANTNPFSISTPSGTSLYINNTKYISNGGTSAVFPGYLGTLEFTADAYSQWVSTSSQPEIGSVSLASGAGFASAALTQIPASTVHAGQFTFTIPSGSTGTAGSVGITITNTTATSRVPSSCDVKILGVAVVGFSSVPTASSWTWTPSGAIPSGSYTGAWTCTY